MVIGGTRWLNVHTVVEKYIKVQSMERKARRKRDIKCGGINKMSELKCKFVGG